MTPEQRQSHDEISHALYFLEDEDLRAYFAYLDADPNMTVETALTLANGLIILDQ